MMACFWKGFPLVPMFDSIIGWIRVFGMLYLLSLVSVVPTP